MLSRKNRMTDREKALAKRLTKEKNKTACLRRENASLRRQLFDARAGYAADRPAVSEPTSAYLFAEKAAAADRLAVRSFPRYVSSLLNGSYLAYLWRRWVKVFRRLKLVRTLLTVASAILASAVLAALVLAVLPFLLVGLAVSLMGIFLTARHRNRKMAAALCGKRVIAAAVPTGTAWTDKPLLLRMARAAARTPGYAVLLLSPYHLINDGPGGRRPYFTVRREAENLYLVRPLYWFSLRKRVLRAEGVDTVVIY